MNRPLWRTAAMATAVAALAAFTAVATPARAFPPSTRAALTGYLNSISGQYTLSGQHNREPNSDPTRYTRVALEEGVQARAIQTVT